MIDTSNHPPTSRFSSGALVLALLLVGCASSQPLSPQLTSSLATAGETINQARSAEAARYAPLELQSAEQKLAAAQVAIAKKHNEEAARLASEATVDARLAAIISRSAKSQAVALELQKGIQTLRDEIARKKND